MKTGLILSGVLGCMTLLMNPPETRRNRPIGEWNPIAVFRTMDDCITNHNAKWVVDPANTKSRWGAPMETGSVCVCIGDPRLDQVKDSPAVPLGRLAIDSQN